MAAPLSRSALRARDALVLEHLSLAVAERFRGAVAVASAVARRFFPLVEREDLVQVAREALLRSVLPLKQVSRQSPICAAASQVPCSITCAIGCGWCAFHAGCMSTVNAHWVISALMATPLASRACSISWRPQSKKQPGPLMIWRWSSS